MRLRYALLGILAGLSLNIHGGELLTGTGESMDLRVSTSNPRRSPDGLWQCRPLAPEPGPWRPARLRPSFPNSTCPRRIGRIFPLSCNWTQNGFVGFLIPVLHSHTHCFWIGKSC